MGLISDSMLMLEIKIPQSGKTTVELYNNVGQFTGTLHNGFLTAGTKVLTMPTLPLPAGTYYLKVQSRTITKTIPIILQ